MADRLLFKFCPMCQTGLETRHVFERERQQCPACGWIHFLDPKVGAGVLIEQDGRVLLVRRGMDPGKGLWCLPSGFVEIDESPAEAAVRECKEETNLDVELVGKPDIYHYFHEGRGGGILILYRARVIGGQPRPGDDVNQVCFFEPDSLPASERIAFLSNRTALALWQEEQ
ncbi:MAG: NUDIX domain-containing protein, partial [Anaerolineae bacterium]